MESVTSCMNDGQNDSQSASCSAPSVGCSNTIPTSRLLFQHMPISGYVCVAILTSFVLATAAIYVEEVFFILKHFQKGPRREKTIWILAFFPVYSFCGLMGVVVPRSGTLVDMISNVFFSSCLYNFGYLMIHYIGGEERMWQLVGTNQRHVQLNTPPCCCCCVCLPTAIFNKRFYLMLKLSVLQVAVIRPTLMFIAAVLWTDNAYIPGDISSGNAYIYISVVNVASTLIAYYGLTVMRGALHAELEEDFKVTGKILSLQLTLLCSTIPNLIIAILVSTNVIQCGPLFPSKARGEMITAGFMIIIMLPFSLLGRKFYRRSSDGSRLASSSPQQLTDVTTELKQLSSAA